MGFMILRLLYKSILKWTKKKKKRERKSYNSWCFWCWKLIDLAMDLKNNSHGFFFPSEPLLPSDECLYCPAKLLITHVIFRVIFLTRISAFPAFFRHWPPQFPASFIGIVFDGILRLSSPINLCLMSSIRIHHDYSLLSTSANFHPAFFTLLHNFIVKMGFIVLLSLVLARELPGFRKENDDNGVTDHKHKARTDEGDGQIPEVLAGDLDGKRQLKGKLGDQDQNKAYLDHPEQIGDLPKLAVPQDGVGLLDFDAIDLEWIHISRPKLGKTEKSLDKKMELEDMYVYTHSLVFHSKENWLATKAWELAIFLSWEEMVMTAMLEILVFGVMEKRLENKKIYGGREEGKKQREWAIWLMLARSFCVSSS